MGIFGGPGEMQSLSRLPALPGPRFMQMTMIMVARCLPLSSLKGITSPRLQFFRHLFREECTEHSGPKYEWMPGSHDAVLWPTSY